MKKQMRPLARVSLLALPLVLGAGLVAQHRTFGDDPAKPVVIDYADQITRLVEAGKIDDLSKLSIPKDSETAKLQAWTDSYVSSVRKQEGERDKEFADETGKVQDLLKKSRYDKALDHAVAAFEIAGTTKDQTDFLKLPWVDDLTTRTAAAAADLEKHGQWLESYQLYFDLNTLHEIDTHYKSDMKRLERRIRLLALYTPQTLFDLRKAIAAKLEKEKESEGPSTKPALPPPGGVNVVPKELTPATPTAPIPAVEDESINFPKWRDSIEGIAPDMVHDVMEKTQNDWVEITSYQALVTGGVDALRLFLTTPELAKVFPALGDAAARATFARALDDASAKIAGLKDASADDVSDIVRSLADASAASVKLPEQVVEMEFTDGAMEKVDPFTQVFWPHDLAEFQKGTTGSFGGVGIQIGLGGQDNGQLKVISPLEHSPALEAGIYAGDIITAIDGKPTLKMSIDDAVHTITGTPGTPVVLTIQRKGVPDKDYTLNRAQINVSSVKGFERDTQDTAQWNFMIDPASKIGYVRLTQFQSESAQQMHDALTELKNQGVRGVIMDLRFNGGGLLPAAISISDMFLQEGTIVSTKGRSVNTRPHSWTADHDPVIPPNMPLIVLVNQYSASASEIYSGAMKDLHRGMIVGHRSYGKGSVQNLLQIGAEVKPDGSPQAMMKLTMAYYYLPNKENLHRRDGATTWGVEPDVSVDMTPKQMDDLRLHQRDVDIIHRPGEPAQTEPATAATKEAPFDDTQLDTALMIMRLQLVQAAP